MFAATAGSCATEIKDRPGRQGGGTQEAALGDPLTLKAFETQLRVTPTRVIDPLEVGRFDRPLNKGSRFVAIEVEIENTGSASYVDSPANGASLISDRKEQADTAFVTGGDCSDAFASNLRLSPGSTQRGCVPFELEEGSDPATFQFGPDSGFGPQAGEWRIP